MGKSLKNTDPEVASIIDRELRRQVDKLEMIASENFVSEAVLEATGSVLTNKYAEGYPSKRYYRGCEYYDEVENIAVDRAKKLFNAEHANVQPHSGSQANLEVYAAVLSPGDVVMGMNLSHGGHLTHGSPVNFSGQTYKFCSYGVSKDTDLIEYDEVLKIAKESKPRLIVVGASAYPRELDYAKFGEIAREVNAVLLADIAHIAGLVVSGCHPSPFPHCDIVTTTTHKTLRGPRGGLILSKKEFAKKIDKAVFPGCQGGPLMHVIAAKAVALKEAASPEFKKYSEQVVLNARALCDGLLARGFNLVSGGTDTHLALVDVGKKGLTGKVAAEALDNAGVTANKNEIPFDPYPPGIASGVRLGTPALTSRGMREGEMKVIAGLIADVLDNVSDEALQCKIREQVKEMCSNFPLYSSLLARSDA